MPRLSVRKSSKKLRIKNSVKRSKVTNGKSRGKSKKVTKKTKTKRQRGSGNGNANALGNANAPGNAPGNANAPEEKSPLQLKLQLLIDMFFEQYEFGERPRALENIYTDFVLQLRNYILKNGTKDGTKDGIIKTLFAEVTTGQNDFFDELLDDNYKSKKNTLFKHAYSIIPEIPTTTIPQWNQDVLDSLLDPIYSEIDIYEYNKSHVSYTWKAKYNYWDTRYYSLQHGRRYKGLPDKNSEEGNDTTLEGYEDHKCQGIFEKSRKQFWNQDPPLECKDYRKHQRLKNSELRKELLKLFAQLPFVRQLVLNWCNKIDFSIWPNEGIKDLPSPFKEGTEFNQTRNVSSLENLENRKTINYFNEKLLENFDNVMRNPFEEREPEPEPEPEPVTTQRKGFFSRFRRKP